MTNIVLLVGNLGDNPETRTTGSGVDVTNFRIGTSRPKRDSEDKTFKGTDGFTAKDTEWHRITCFNGLGRAVADHAKKGMLVSVQGRIHNTRWSDSEGIERYGYEIIAEEVQFLSRPRESADTGSDSPADPPE